VSALITAIHIITCFILIIAVLLQSGKAADLAGAFGGIGSQTVFGPRGAGTILSKVTTVSAILFMLTSMGLWILSAKGTKSVVKGEEPAAEKAAVTETQKKTEQEKATAGEPDKEKQKTGSDLEKKTDKKEEKK
jgi:preprotein translocase subunit SecG